MIQIALKLYHFLQPQTSPGISLNFRQRGPFRWDAIKQNFLTSKRKKIYIPSYCTMVSSLLGRPGMGLRNADSIEQHVGFRTVAWGYFPTACEITLRRGRGGGWESGKEERSRKWEEMVGEGCTGRPPPWPGLVAGTSCQGRGRGGISSFHCLGKPIRPVSDMTEKKCCAEQKGSTYIYLSTKQVNKLTLLYIYISIGFQGFLLPANNSFACHNHMNIIKWMLLQAN